MFIIGSYDREGKADAMNLACGGISYDTELCLCITAGHKTTKNILEKKAFTVSMATAGQMAACDYVGIVSGNDTPDKLEKAGFHTRKAEYVDAPMIEELPMTLECRLISYDLESYHLFGEIVNVSADESILTDGKIDIAKLAPITFDPVGNAYL